MEEVDLLIIGGGVVGLACARQTARAGRTVCLLERHAFFGAETSSHNSGVIHAGIYYPEGSLKARLCVEGRHALYEYCAAQGVPYRRSGKLIVANQGDDEIRLADLLARGRANGVDDLEIVDQDFIRRLEPHVTAWAALWSPSSGIVEAEALVRTLHRDAVNRGTIMLPAMPLVHGEAHDDRFEVRTPAESIRARAVINAAGLQADEVSLMLGGRAFQIHPCRGEYAEVVGASRDLVRRPVYPMPAPEGEHLGMHVTPTTWGSVMIGPTARYLTSKNDYEGDRLPVEAFLKPTRMLFPTISLGDLRLGSTGIRSKLSLDANVFSDFLIARDPDQPRLIQAAGIDSPGLTACLAIGRHVSTLVDEILD